MSSDVFTREMDDAFTAKQAQYRKDRFWQVLCASISAARRDDQVLSSDHIAYAKAVVIEALEAEKEL